MVLLNLFHKAEFKFVVAHCNFKLRGEESDGDEKMVIEHTQSLGMTCLSRNFETKEYAESKGISIQMAARELRRVWFEQLIKENNLQFIATAHHLNDSLETVIFNLTKGTGLSGLKGIPPKNGCYIRPLMFTKRSMIQQFANENNLTWREDQSNSSVKYHRNLIRHRVIPELRKINPNLEETFLYSSEKLLAAEQIVNDEISDCRAELLEKTSSGFKISKANIQNIADSAFTLFEILKKFSFNFSQVKDLLNALSGQAGKTIFSTDHKISIDREYVFVNRLEKNTPETYLVEDNETRVQTAFSDITFEIISSNQVNFSNDNNIAFLDLESLRFPLKIRLWAHGDRFRPLGMHHKKKLSDFMIDEKIPLNLKERVLVLTSEENIVWVIGYRIDDRYKVTANTNKIFKICNNIKDD